MNSASSYLMIPLAKLFLLAIILAVPPTVTQAVPLAVVMARTLPSLSTMTCQLLRMELLMQLLRKLPEQP